MGDSEAIPETEGISPYTARAHRAKRRALVRLVTAGLVDCARCHERIQPSQAWDFGHVDGDRAEGARREGRRGDRRTLLAGDTVRDRSAKTRDEEP